MMNFMIKIEWLIYIYEMYSKKFFFERDAKKDMVQFYGTLTF